MIYVLTREEMRAADEAAGSRIGRPALMHAAGEGVAQRARALVPMGSRVIAFAGPGDNGGDAFAALASLGTDYECELYAEPSPKASEARRCHEQRAANAGIRPRPLPERETDALQALDGAAVAIDGLFGTGSRLPIAEKFRASARALDARRLPVVAIDVPSGVDADSGAVSDDAVRATETLTLAALKPGLLLETARENVGALWCSPIGIDADELARNARTHDALDDAAFLRMLPRRPFESDKRASGAPLVIAGSRQFPGAAVLCALGAARAGAGYVTVATPASAAPALRTHLVEQVVVELDEGAPAQGVVDDLCDAARHNSSIAIGPGLGLEARTGEIVRGAIARIDLPIVADASALFHIGKHLDELRGKRIVLTPHAGEFARLSGKGTVAKGERVARLREFVDRTGVTTLLKGMATLVYDGSTLSINTTGSNALATAGTGDVLTGIVGTLLSQGLSAFDAARAGAYWHGLAGRHAARRRPRGVIARDVIEALAEAVPSYASLGTPGMKRVF